MADQNFTKIPVQFDLGEGSGEDMLRVSNYLKQLEKVLATITDNGVSFASSIKRTDQFLQQDFYVQANKAKNALKAFDSIATRFEKNDEASIASGVEQPNPFSIGGSSKVDLTSFQQKILSSKRELAAIKAEIASFGGQMTASDKEGYFDITMPNVPVGYKGFDVPAADLMKSRIGEMNRKARSSKAESLKKEDPEAYESYVQQQQRTDNIAMSEHDELEKKLSSQIRRNKDGSFDKRQQKLIQEYEKIQATGELTKGIERSSTDYDAMDDMLFSDGKDRERKRKEAQQEDSSESGGLSTLKLGIKFFLVIKLVKQLVDVARKILSGIDNLARRTTEDARDGVAISMSPLQLQQYRRMEQARGLPQGTSEGAMQTLQNIFGVTQSMDNSAIESLALVVGEDLSRMIQRGLTDEGMSPEYALNTILNAYMTRFKKGETSLGQSTTEPLSELASHIGKIDSNLALLFTQMANDSIGRDTGLSKAAGMSFFDWISYANEGLKNPAGMTNETVEELKEINKILGSIKSIWEGFIEGFTAQLAISFRPFFEFTRNASRFFMDAESKEADVLAARYDSEIKLDEAKLHQNVLGMQKERNIEEAEQYLTALGVFPNDIPIIMQSMEDGGGNITSAILSMLHHTDTPARALRTIKGELTNEESDFYALFNKQFALSEAEKANEKYIKNLEENIASGTSSWITTNPSSVLTSSFGISARRSSIEMRPEQLLESLGRSYEGVYSGLNYTNFESFLNNQGGLNHGSNPYKKEAFKKELDEILEGIFGQQTDFDTDYSEASRKQRIARKVSSMNTIETLGHTFYSVQDESIQQRATKTNITVDDQFVTIQIMDGDKVLASELLRNSFSINEGELDINYDNR